MAVQQLDDDAVERQVVVGHVEVMAHEMGEVDETRLNVELLHVQQEQLVLE